MNTQRRATSREREREGQDDFLLRVRFDLEDRAMWSPKRLFFRTARRYSLQNRTPHNHLREDLKWTYYRLS
jgi:hypothetical protein